MFLYPFWKETRISLRSITHLPFPFHCNTAILADYGLFSRIQNKQEKKKKDGCT